MSDCSSQLLDRYRAAGLTHPDWAYPLPPTIPFIGKHYPSWGGILVYGSAENLAHYERDPDTRPIFLKDDRVRDRHRAAFSQDPGGFFPRVHMAPFEDGSLLVALWYLVWLRHGAAPNDPRELLESTAAANFCKFSIAGLKNRDYAGDRAKLTTSVPYVRADLTVLQPATIILPRSIWKHREMQVAIRAVAATAEIVALPQFNPRVVNIHLARHAERARELETELNGTPVASWIARMQGYAQGTPYRFLAEMTALLAK